MAREVNSTSIACKDRDKHGCSGAPPGETVMAASAWTWLAAAFVALSCATVAADGAHARVAAALVQALHAGAIEIQVDGGHPPAETPPGGSSQTWISVLSESMHGVGLGQDRSLSLVTDDNRQILGNVRARVSLSLRERVPAQHGHAEEGHVAEDWGCIVLRKVSDRAEAEVDMDPGQEESEDDGCEEDGEGWAVYLSAG